MTSSLFADSRCTNVSDMIKEVNNSKDESQLIAATSVLTVNYLNDITLMNADGSSDARSV